MSEVKNEERGYRKTRRGYVVSDKMDKTVVVEVEDHVKHALFAVAPRLRHTMSRTLLVLVTSF